MRYRFFNSSKKSWQAMYEVISTAQHSIYLEMYIFQDDMPDFNFFLLLKEKANNGLKVVVILDSFGSAGLSKKAVSELKEAGVELIFLSYFLYRTHRKVLIVDERVAFIGGVNFHQSASLWNDLVVEVKGKLVSSIIRSFAKVYFECGGKDSLIISYNKKILKDKMSDWILEHFPVKNKFRLKKIYKENLMKAKEDITIVSPYFMPKRWLIGLLHQAVLRGVAVSILVPKITDHYFIDRVNYFFMHKVSKLGVNIYLEPKMNHAKLMIIDSKMAIVGSHNLDYLSFELNSEVGIFFQDLNVIKKLEKIVAEWKNNTILFDSKIQKPLFFDYILSPIIGFFNRIL